MKKAANRAAIVFLAVAMVFAFMPGGIDIQQASAATSLTAPTDVKLIADVSENGRLTGKDTSLTARWSVVAGAAGYYLTPYIVENGKETALCDPIDINDPNVLDGTVSCNLTYEMLLDYSNGNGMYMFKVQAYDGSGTGSDAVESNRITIWTINLEFDAFDYGMYIRALDGSDIVACLNEAFKERNEWYYIGEDGNYYAKASSPPCGSEKVICFTPESVRDYSSLAEMKADAYFVPGESTPNVKTLHKRVDVHVITESLLCTDGELHTYDEISVIQKATDEQYGYGRATCSKCHSASTYKYYMPVGKIKLSKTSYVYTGKALKPGVTVTAKEAYQNALIPEKSYTVKYTNNVNAGTAKVTVKMDSDYYDCKDKTATFTITKAKNPLTVKGRTAIVKYSKVKKAAQKLALYKVIKTSKKGQGTVIYTKSKGNSKITIAKKTGKVTVKKGIKKGTYTVKVKVKAAGTKNYKARTRTVTFKIKVN